MSQICKKSVAFVDMVAIQAYWLLYVSDAVKNRVHHLSAKWEGKPSSNKQRD